jgi:hypothetical protein
MSSGRAVKWFVQYFVDGEETPCKPVELGDDCLLRPAGPLGPTAIGPVEADLLDLAGTMFLLERRFTGRQRTRPIRAVRVKLALRRPEVWTAAARHLSDILYLLGRADWTLNSRTASGSRPWPCPVGPWKRPRAWRCFPAGSTARAGSAASRIRPAFASSPSTRTRWACKPDWPRN